MFYAVHFNDEAPQFGSGVRIVYTNGKGRRKLQLLSPYNCQAVSIKREVWERMRPEQIAPKKTLIREALRRNIPRDHTSKILKTRKREILASLGGKHD